MPGHVMSIAVPSTHSSQKLTLTSDLGLLFLSIILQIGLGLLFGHVYDMRIFMATGYLVGTGQNPYIAQDLSNVFNNPIFQGITTIGYLPPWALVLGVIYRCVYAVFHNLVVYNLAIKIPVIAANIGLAYLVVDVLKKLGVDSKVSRRAWVFLLLNPFLLYFGSAWGQFDALVACLSLGSIILLYDGRYNWSAVLLALAISFKPIALPLLPVVLIFLDGKSRWQAVRYLGLFILSVLLFCIAPFILFHWDPSPIIKGWNAHFMVGGGMSFMTFFELLKDAYQLPGLWWLLGLAWIPALGVGIYVLISTQKLAQKSTQELANKLDERDLTNLITMSTALIFIFFLTRAWLSEPNVTLLIPFVVILTSIGALPSLTLTAVWTLPLAFTIFNTSPPQLLFLNFPEAMVNYLRLSDQFRFARLIIRTILVIPWQIAGWWMVVACFKK